MMSFRANPRLVRAVFAAMIGAAAITGATGNTAGRRSRTAEESEKPSPFSELGSKSICSKVWGKNEDYQPFTGEPPRANLIEPPAGYRAPSPAQPYGVGKDRWVAPKVDRQEPAR